MLFASWLTPDGSAVIPCPRFRKLFGVWSGRVLGVFYGERLNSIVGVGRTYEDIIPDAPALHHELVVGITKSSWELLVTASASYCNDNPLGNF